MKATNAGNGMNFVKRAGSSLLAGRSRTAGLLAVFTVICALLLGGVLLRDAAARHVAQAQRTVGVDVTVRQKGRLTPALADRIGASDPVHRYNAEVPVRGSALGFTPLAPASPSAPGPEAGPAGALNVRGVRDSEMLLPFSYGSTRITAGRGIEPRDAGRGVVLVERRLAARNGLAPGDTLRVRSADGRRTHVLTVIGVFRDPTRDPTGPRPSHELPGNTLYVPVGTAEHLSGGASTTDEKGDGRSDGKGDANGKGAIGEAGDGTVSEAVFRIGSPDRAKRLHAEVGRILGGDFEFRVNDRAYRDRVRPVERVGGFAGLLVRVISVAGALILGLVVTLRIRERRAELGVLLALGERKWRLLGQHVVEVAAVAVPAVLLAAVAASLAGPYAGRALLDGPESGPESGSEAGAGANRDGGPPEPGPGRAGGSGTAPHPKPELNPDADPAQEPPAVRVDAAAVGEVALLALGIALVSTVVPGIGILRLHPRSLLTDTD
ncbi:ABC transporter permease [Streptomyces sp. NPDC097619]|uniref:ABC transporter permease n=1 Tax=Streptomyces sp. NPDC097619 TaxID=3157228 RepID=UPI00332CADCF